MFIINHKIAGIKFKTDSDVEIFHLKNGFFQRFLEEDPNPDVYIRICGISRDTLKLPPLNGPEKMLMARCIYPPYLGRGTLTLPLLHRKSEENAKEYKSQNSDILNAPLLRSPLVRTRLLSCLDHPEQVGLVLHVSSVIIRDHLQRRIDLFYPSENNEIFETSFPEYGFRRLFSSFLPAFSAVMVHSSGLVRNDKTALFLAPDEGGKTTVVESSEHGTILGDDQIILRKEKGAVVAYGTPWGSIASRHHFAEVGGVFLLEKASQFELVPLKPLDAMEYFWNEHLFYRVFLPRNLRVKAFETMYDACSQAPVYLMRFPKNFVDWEAIDAVMEDRLAA